MADSRETLLKEPSRQARLRSATRQAHDRIDVLAETAGFFDGHEQYAAYLEATWRARRSIELALDRYRAETLYPIWPQRRITNALLDDIRDVTGREPPDDEIRMPAIRSSAQALGILYVLEGSALGAHVIAPRAAISGMTANYGARHLALQTATSGAWKAFLAILETFEFDDNHENACIAAALTSFERFETAYATVAPAKV